MVYVFVAAELLGQALGAGGHSDRATAAASHDGGTRGSAGAALGEVQVRADRLLRPVCGARGV